jgi:hypothetical protein
VPFVVDLRRWASETETPQYLAPSVADEELKTAGADLL